MSERRAYAAVGGGLALPLDKRTGKFARAHVTNLLGCVPAILFASAIRSCESNPDKYELGSGKCRCYLGGSRKKACENFLGHLFERNLMSLSIERVDDFVEAHKVTDQGQILAIACRFRLTNAPATMVPISVMSPM